MGRPEGVIGGTFGRENRLGEGLGVDVGVRRCFAIGRGIGDQRALRSGRHRSETALIDRPAFDRKRQIPARVDDHEQVRPARPRAGLQPRHDRVEPHALVAQIIHVRDRGLGGHEIVDPALLARLRAQHRRARAMTGIVEKPSRAGAGRRQSIGECAHLPVQRPAVEIIGSDDREARLLQRARNGRSAFRRLLQPADADGVILVPDDERETRPVLTLRSPARRKDQCDRRNCVKPHAPPSLLCC